VLPVDVRFPSASKLANSRPLEYQTPGSPVIGFPGKAPWPVILNETEPSGWPRPWKDPVATRVIDLPESRFVNVTVLAGKGSRPKRTIRT